MRNRIMAKRAGMAIAAALVLLPATLFGADKKYQKIKSPALRDIQVPQVTRVTLDNGMQVFVVEDHELPLFRLTLTLKAGYAFDPAAKLGLAQITAGVLRSGGSEKLPGDRMDEVLEGMGGSLESNADVLTTTVGINVLIEDASKSMSMLRDLLLQPAYPEDKLDLELKQWRSAIARRNDDPQGIAEREFDKLMYGADHPFVRQTEYEHLDRIERSDLLDFHRTYYHPTDAYLAVWGDFDTQEVLQQVRDTFGAWPRASVKYPDIPPVPATSPSVNLAVKESVNQSTILIGHRGTTLEDPDYYALSVMNEILGGSFGSRLFNEVRSRQGLSYRVGSGLGAGLEYPGIFTVRCGTKSETTVQATRASIEEVRKMKTEAITPEELQRAKDGILNSHVFNFTSKGAIVNRQIAYVRNGYPPDFLEQYAKGIAAVSVEDVKRAAGKYLQPDQFATLVVGRPADFGEPLSALGSVREIDITIPEPKVQEDYPAPTPETLARGKQILAAAAKATGGVENLRKLTDVTEQAELTLSMMGRSLPGKMTRYVKYPGNTRSEIDIMGQKIVQVFNAGMNLGFQSMGPQAKDMESSELAQAKSEQARDFVEFLRNADAYSPQYLGEADVKGAPADVLLLSPAGLERFKVFVDRKSSLVVKEEYKGRNFQGAPVHEELFLENYKKVGALTLPHSATVVQDGEQFLKSETSSFSWTVIPVEKFRKTES